MANPYADPTSIDYILQRAQDELRRGENQHARASEAQYTNHVKELLGNLERYLETCGVQLPSEVITGAEATVAAAAAALNEVNAQREAARSPFSGSQVKSGYPGAKWGYANPLNRSLSASAALEGGRSYRDTSNTHPRVGWGTLATPTEAQQLECPGNEKRLSFADAALAALPGKPETTGAALTASLGSNNNCSFMSPKSRREMETGQSLSNATVKDPPGYGEKGSPVVDDGQRTLLQCAGPPYPHSPPGGGAANPAVAPFDASPLRVGERSPHVLGRESSPLAVLITANANVKDRSAQPDSSPLLLGSLQRTPHAESVNCNVNPLISSETAAAAHARSVSLNVIAAGSCAHAGSGADQWGDFGQFVQSVTESRVNSNPTTQQSAAVIAAYSAPTNGYTVSNGLSGPSTSAARSCEKATGTTVSANGLVDAVSPNTFPDNGFQLPYVFLTGSSLTSPSTKELPQRQAQRDANLPMSVKADTSPGVVQPVNGASTRNGSGPSSQQHPTTTTDITSISSCSPSLPLQAAYGAGGNAVRALAAATTEVVQETPKGKGGWYTAAGEGPHTSPVWSSPVEHLPSLPQHRRLSIPSSAQSVTGAEAPVQRSASLPTNGDYLPYGKGGSPFYPHILRVCASATSPTPKMQLSSPVRPLSRKPSVAGQATSVSPPSPPHRAEDSEAVAHTQEKEQLMRRLRGILGRSSSLSAMPAVVTSFTDVGGHPSLTNGNSGGVVVAGGDEWGSYEAYCVKSEPASAPRVVAVSPLRRAEGEEAANEDGQAEGLEGPSWHRQPLPATGAIYPSPVTVRSTSNTRAPPHTLHLANTQSPSSLLDEPAVHQQQLHRCQDDDDDTVQPTSTAQAINPDTTVAPHATSASFLHLHLRTPSSKDMCSLPTGLCSVSRKTLLSHDLSAGGLSSGTRSANPSPHHPYRNQQQHQQQPVPAPGLTNCSYTTAYSTAASTFKTSTVAPPMTSNGVTVHMPSAGEVPLSQGAVSPVMNPYACVANSNDVSPSGGSLHNNYLNGTEKETEGVESFAADSGVDYEAADSRNGVGVCDEKQQLMQRLRMMLSRPDE